MQTQEKISSRFQKKSFPFNDRPMKGTLSLTHQCNMACTYCYSGQSLNLNMSYTTAKKAVDFLFARTAPGQDVTFYFFGGEPLLCFFLIKKITSYIRNYDTGEYGQIGFSVTTNGLLLSSEILNFFSREKFKLCISLDGIESVHNRHRHYPSGRHTFHKVLKNLHMTMEYLPNVQINAVYSPQTLPYLVESAAFLNSLGASAIHLSPDIKTPWKPETYANIDQTFEKIADDYVNTFQQGQEVAVQPIDSKLIVLLKEGYDIADTCRAGETDWSFSPNGNIYACERFIGEDTGTEHCLGHVDSEIVTKPHIVKPCRSGLSDYKCQECGVSRYCMNWCACSNYHMTGASQKISPFLCISEKAVIHASASVLSRLQDNNLFLDHMMAYMQAA